MKEHNLWSCQRVQPKSDQALGSRCQIPGNTEDWEHFEPHCAHALSKAQSMGNYRMNGYKNYKEKKRMYVSQNLKKHILSKYGQD